MEISKKELQELVNEAVERKVTKLFKESNDFSAKRRIIQAAHQASMEFEEEIKSGLNLRNPDDLEPAYQQKYFEVVEAMKQQIADAVSNATKMLVKFPRNDDGSNEQK